MSDQMLYDSQINGIGKINGGTFNKVKIDGIGEVSGDITCNAFYCNGKGKVKGHVLSKSFQVQGMCKVMGKLESLKIRFDGTATIEDGIVSEVVEGNGVLSLDAGCETEVFQVSGKVDIYGLLNADQVKLELLAKCRIRDIGGEQIIVKQGKSKGEIMNKLLSSFVGSPQLIAETIEGDHISLEYTKAQVVRGNSITLGPGCEIERVEYKSHLSIDERSRVKQRVML